MARYPPGFPVTGRVVRARSDVVSDLRHNLDPNGMNVVVASESDVVLVELDTYGHLWSDSDDSNSDLASASRGSGC